MAPPRIPPELIADLIELTVELLVEEERHLEAHAPLSNRFLLSAALVDRTWHSIATPVLLKNGIVTSRSVVGFLAQVKAHGMEATLKSVRFGEASGGVTTAAAEDAAFNLLVEKFSGLSRIELVDSGSHFQTALPPGRTIQEVHLSNYDISSGGFQCKFGRSPPSHLVATDTRRQSGYRFATTKSLLRLLGGVPSFKIIGDQPSGLVLVHFFNTLWFIGNQARGSESSRLETCHFECTSPRAYHKLLQFIRRGYQSGHQKPFSFPHLERLTIHLVPADFLLALGSQPTLATLEILPDPPGLDNYESTSESPPEKLLSQLLHALPVLENLKVPASWASDAVRDACDAKGVKLRAT